MKYFNLIDELDGKKIDTYTNAYIPAVGKTRFNIVIRLDDSELALKSLGITENIVNCVNNNLDWYIDMIQRDMIQNDILCIPSDSFTVMSYDILY